MLCTLFCVDLFTDPSIGDRNLYLERQQVSVERALLTDKNIQSNIMRYLLRDDGDRNNCCLWRTCRCTDGLLKTFVLTKPLPYADDIYAYDLNTSWLPHSLEFLHVTNAEFPNRFSISTLPRSLRYCYLHGTRHADLRFRRALTVLDLSQLPQKIEELDLRPIDALFGTVYVPDLPRSMRICLIRIYSVWEVYVANDGLPESLEIALFTGGKVKLWSTTPGKLDKRISKDFARLRKVKCLLSEQCKDIVAEITQELLPGEII